MTPDELRSRQDQLTAPVTAASLRVLRLLPAQSLSDDAFARLLLLLFPVIVKARTESAHLAAAFYATQAPRRRAPDVPVPAYPVTALRAALETPRTDIAGQRSIRAGLATPDAAPRAVVLGAAVVSHHVEQAGREWVIDATDADDVRFARTDPLSETCGFCRLLISRGPAYRSEVSGSFKSHPRCSCVAVPVFNDNWAGREQYEAAEALYRETTAGLSGKEARNAFRRAVESPDLST